MTIFCVGIKRIPSFIYPYILLTCSSPLHSLFIFSFLCYHHHHSSMSFLRLNGFLTAGKAWKIFASKFQRKLHKLNMPKQPIRKPYKSRFSKPAKRKISWHCLCAQRKKFKHKKKLTKTTHVYHRHHFQRNPSLPVVYVDQLFIKPVSVIEEDYANPSSVTASAVHKVAAPFSSSANKDEDDTGATADQDSADYMWESMVLASPQLNRINERAEEFIAKFRADMRLQERLAHCL